MNVRVLEPVNFLRVQSKLSLELYLSMLLQFPEAQPVLVAKFVSYSNDVATVQVIEAVNVVRQLQGFQLNKLDLEKGELTSFLVPCQPVAMRRDVWLVVAHIFMVPIPPMVLFPFCYEKI